ncbi:MAG: hypothetical protein AMXMBFR64_50430 [Myxococcales bacterium]
MDIESIRALARAGSHDEAAGALATALAAPEPRDHVEWGRLAAELGDVHGAIRELQLAVRDAPANPDILGELAELYRDLGDVRREAALRERLAALEGRECAADERLILLRGLSPDEPRAKPPVAPLAEESDADRVRFVHLFGGREDVYARMWSDPRKGVGYSPIERPLTPDVVRAHLAGSATVGSYVVRLDGTVTFLVVDLDITRRAVERARGDRDETRRLRRLVHTEGLRLRSALEERGLPAFLEDSGYKGRHLWCFLREPLPADLAHRLGVALTRALAPQSRDLALEAFPKQGTVKAGGLGNLVKLPLGIHLRSGRRAMLLDEAGGVVHDPWPLLREAPRLERDTVLKAMETLRAAPVSVAAVGARDEEDTEPLPPVQRPLTPAPFTEADFTARAEVAVMLRGCPVLASLVDRGLTHRRLTHDERVVLRHSLGHTPAGLLAVNYLFERCPEVPPQDFLKTRLSGNPISCAAVRRRVPHVSSQVACHCEFASAGDQYPSPLLHLEEARALGTLAPRTVAPETAPEAPDAPDAQELARAYALLMERQRAVEAELQATRAALLERATAKPDRRLPVAGGAWTVKDDEGMPVLCWEPDQAPGA